MNRLRLPSLLLAYALLASFVAVVASGADDPKQIEPGSQPTGVTLFVIANGTIGNKKPATVRNVIEAISWQYPTANITVVGLENVVIENLTIQTTKIFQRSGLPPGATHTSADGIVQQIPLEAMLAALVEASGHKILVRGYGSNAFLLSPPDAPPTQKAIEVFNLGSMKRSRINAAIQEDIRRAEAELAVLRTNYGDKHPKVVEITTRIDVLKAQLTSAASGGADSSKLIDEILEVVSDTLALKPGDQWPQFKFHAGTNLLVVIGSEQSIDVTRKVIAALEKTP